MSKKEQLEHLIHLLEVQRWAALATVDAAGQPMASMAGYVMSEELDSVVLHLSRLAAHTRNVLAYPSASLVVSAHDDGHQDPQLLVRASVQGRVEIIERDNPLYAPYRSRYLQRLPDSARLFDFPDFILFGLVISEIRFVAGFGQAFTYRPEEWRKHPSAS